MPARNGENMDKSLHLRAFGKYEKFTDSDDKNDEDHILNFIGTPIRLRANVGGDEEVEYGYICDAWWCEDMDGIDCRVLLYGEDGRFHGKFKYLLTSLDKQIGPTTTKGMHVYRVWDEEGEHWCKNFRNGRTLWMRKGDAKRVREYKCQKVKTFRLVEVE
jgi:hypothetical protein